VKIVYELQLRLFDPIVPQGATGDEINLDISKLMKDHLSPWRNRLSSST
jgi:hypothetical protein